MNNVTRIFILDDHEIVRQGLKSLFDRNEGFEVVGEASSIKDFEVSSQQVSSADLLLLDYYLQDGDGSQVITKIRSAYPSMKILILSGFIEHRMVERIRLSEIDGYLLKESDGAQILLTIGAIMRGEKVLSPVVQAAFDDMEINRLRPSQAIHAFNLGQRERQVLVLVAQGKLNKEIAAELGIAEKSVRNLITGLFKKLKVSNRTEAAILYRTGR